MILEIIRRRVVGNVLIDISPSNIFQNILLLRRFPQNCQIVYGRCERSWVNEAHLELPRQEYRIMVSIKYRAMCSKIRIDIYIDEGRKQ